jgi:CHAT domain-containing protein
MTDPIFSGEDPRIAKSEDDKKRKLYEDLDDQLMSMQNAVGINWPRLKLTAQLGDFLKSLNPGRTDLFTAQDAAKPMLFSQPLAEYMSMVFATHGYFGVDLPGVQEPVLVLTLTDQPSGQDGFLRMSEVMGLKLQADVVALTACQTGLGRRISGEGTMGMGRAFQYAGADAVLMSLWSVHEMASVRLVENFFRYLSEGKDRLEAMHLARSRIRDEGYNHPFFWSSFILVGEMGL